MIKGETFLITTGAYSDFGISGKFLVQADFDLDSELTAWLGKNPRARKEYIFEPLDFLADLEGRGLIAETSFLVVHLGDYGVAPEHPEATARDKMSKADHG
jgi:hypothetical protein